MRRQWTCLGIIPQSMRVWIPDPGGGVSHPVLWAPPAPGKAVFCGSRAGTEGEKQRPRGVYTWCEVGGGLRQGLGV